VKHFEARPRAHLELIDFHASRSLPVAVPETVLLNGRPVLVKADGLHIGATGEDLTEATIMLSKVTVRRARPWERVHRKAVLAVKKRRPPWRRWVKHSQWIGRGVIDRALRRTPDPHRWGRPLFTNRQWYQQCYRLIGKETT
jgi:hypothetical protein